MYKIRKVIFKDHPVLKNLELDFGNEVGEAVDTIIIAGENGSGKSTILNELYKISTHKVDSEEIVELEKDGEKFCIEYYRKGNIFMQKIIKD